MTENLKNAKAAKKRLKGVTFLTAQKIVKRPSSGGQGIIPSYDAKKTVPREPPNATQIMNKLYSQTGPSTTEPNMKTEKHE